MVKKTVSIRIDENLWFLAKDKLPSSRSEFIENQIKLFLDINDPEKKIVEKINKKENEINALKDKLCKLRHDNKLKLESESVFDECMVSLNRLHDNLGRVGRNQIRSIAHKNDVPATDLESYCVDCGLNVVNYAEVPKK